MTEWPALRDYSKSRAVLMGTSEYSWLKAIGAASNSLHRMAGLLAGPLCGWPASRMTILENERSPGELPDRLITSFEDTVDVALFYYVGHGQIDLKSRLCLGLVESRAEANRRAATSLPFDAIRDAFMDSPAAIKVIVLDCCFAGLASQPHNSLAASPDDLIDTAAVSGAYTMAATAAYATALYDETSGASQPQTFFTQYLIDLVESGIPGQPSALRLHPLFIHLRDKLANEKLPIPVERSVDAARDFIFAHNAAPAEVQLDVHRELAKLSHRLAAAEAHSAEAEAASKNARLLAEAREEALRSEIAEQTRELEDLREQAQSKTAMPDEQRIDVDKAIDDAQRVLDETTASRQEATSLPVEPVIHPVDASNLRQAGGQSDLSVAMSPVTMKKIDSHISRSDYFFRYKATLRAAKESQEYRNVSVAIEGLLKQYWDATNQILQHRRLEWAKRYLNRLIEATNDERWRLVTTNVNSLEKVFLQLTRYTGDGMHTPVTECVYTPTQEGVCIYVSEVRRVSQQIHILLDDYLRGTAV